MPPKSAHHSGKAKKKTKDDDFEKLLVDLSRVTQQRGQGMRKQAAREEQERKEKELHRKAILEKSKQNAFQEALLQRQKQMQFRQVLQSLLSARSSFLSQPVTDFHSDTNMSNPRFHVAVGEMQGWRSSMEDNHLIDVAFPSGATDSPEALFGVFDGHSGKLCADQCSQRFPDVLRAHSTAGEGCSAGLSIDFQGAFLDLDRQLQGDLGDASGCTAVLVHVSAEAITCASVGDSRAVLCRDGQAVDLSHDHKPELDAEKARITSAGGFVQDNRVNGLLAMSRAMGDFSYKVNKELGPEEQLVVAVPDVISVPREPADSFVVLACDGIFDVLRNEELVAMIVSKKADGLSNVQICEAVCRRCLAPQSSEDGQPARPEGTDNMTIMIVDINTLN